MRNHHRSPALRAIAKPGGVILVMLMLTTPMYACPMCKDSTVNSRQADNKTITAESTSLDFNKSIYVMLGGLVSVIGFTGRVMYKATKLSCKLSW